MTNIQTLPKDIRKNSSQYQIAELENLVDEIKAIILEKRRKSKRGQEIRLLQKLNECVLPEGHLDRLVFLQEKQKSSSGLSEREDKEFDDLIVEEQKWQIKRIKILGKLAQLKGVSIQKLAIQLGLNAPKNV